MLDKAIIEQLKEVFSKLENQITLKIDSSSHQKQQELVAMLKHVASTSDKIQTRESGLSSPHPRFHIFKNDQPVGIRFSGIPGGHEFSSLILAILNSDLKGKLPDSMIQERVKRLKGPIKLRTVISLSCENCPEVVQALNLMSILNPTIEHEMVDGEFIQEDIERLNIQGVPAVLDGDDSVSNGKTTIVDLLEKLETRYGSEESSGEIRDLGNYDVTVIGAGPAGVSAAIYTARKGLKTAIITDRIGGQLQDTKGIENLISVPYTEGPELSNRLNQHLSEYDIDMLEHRRVNKINYGDTKEILLASNEKLNTKALVITTGAKWRELGIEGEKEYLGSGVAFCPHCDGPFYKGKKISVIGGGNSGVEAAIDLAGIVGHVTVIEYADELKADSVLVNKLKSLNNVDIVTNAKTERIVGNGEKVTGLEYEDRSTGETKSIELSGVFVQIGLVPNSAFLDGLVETNNYGEILVDDRCKTDKPGIYAAGDVTNVPYKQIIVAMGEGAKAGLAAFEDIALHG